MKEKAMHLSLHEVARLVEADLNRKISVHVF
jgi:hypothetical protein